MSITRYSKFGQDASRLALWSVASGTEDPGYLATNLSGRDITAPAKMTTTSGIWRADLSGFTGYQTLIGAALIHSNFQPGLEVHLQGSGDPAFGTIGTDAVFTIPDLKNNWPQNPIVRFSGALHPYWQVNVVGDNPVPLSVGHIALLIGEQDLDPAQQGVQWTDTIPVWDDVTEMDVPMDMDLLTQLRSCSIDLYSETGQQEAIDDWWFDARGQILPFIFTPNINENNCYYMTFADKVKTVTYKYETPTGYARTLTIKLKEFGRGMLPTPWLT